MFWLVLSLLLLGLPTWLLLTALEVHVDTRVPLFAVRMAGVCRLTAAPAAGDWQLEVFAFGWSKRWTFVQLFTANAGNRNRPKARRPHAKPKSGRILLRLYGVLRSFRVVKWELALDITDPQVAQLCAPAIITGANAYISPSYCGESYLLLTVRNRPLRMLVAWFRADRSLF